MALRARQTPRSCADLDLSAHDPQQRISDSHTRLRQPVRPALQTGVFLGDQPQPGPDDLAFLLFESRLRERLALSLLSGPAIARAVVRELSAADAAAECGGGGSNQFGCAASTRRDQRSACPAGDGYAPGAGAGGFRVGSAISPTAQQFGRATGLAERRVEFAGDATAAVRQRLFSRTVSPTAQLRRPRHVPALAGGWVRVAEYLALRDAVSLELR